MFAFGQGEIGKLRRVIGLYADERIMPASELRTVTGYELEAFAAVLENWTNDLDAHSDAKRPLIPIQSGH